MALSDIHQMGNKWKKLIKDAEEENPEIIAIAGDLFPKDNGILFHIRWLTHFKRYAKQIKDMGIELVLTLGNDDNQLLIPEFEKMDEEGLIHFVHDKVKKIKGYEFVGMSWVPDYPFTYKFWIKPDIDGDWHVSKSQLGKPCLIDENNKFYNIKGDYKIYLAEKGTIDNHLKDLTSQVENMSKSIWLIHAPPAYMKLDVCGHGEEVGSKAITCFLEKNEPMLTIHGHIHESPEVTGIWKKQVGDTVVLQNGQVGHDVCYSMVQIEDGKIMEVKHSIYGNE